MDERLRPFERLTRPGQFRRVFRRGRTYRSPRLRIHFMPSTGAESRLGLVVKKKLGKSVVRNAIKRSLREVFRRRKRDLGMPYDVVLVPESEPATYAEYASAFESFARHVVSRGRWSKPARRGPKRRDARDSRPREGRSPRAGGRGDRSGGRRRAGDAATAEASVPAGGERGD